MQFRTHGVRRVRRAHLVTATKLQRAPSRNAAFMRQIWARRRLLPDESGVPVAVARCTRVRPSPGAAPLIGITVLASLGALTVLYHPFLQMSTAALLTHTIV